MFGPAHAVVLEHLVERRHSHRAHLRRNQLADRVFHHRAGDAGSESEAIGEVGGGVELAAADVNRAGRGFAERDDARIEPVNQRAEREEVERAVFRNAERRSHDPQTLWLSHGSCQGTVRIWRRLSSPVS